MVDLRELKKGDTVLIELELVGEDKQGSLHFCGVNGSSYDTWFTKDQARKHIKEIIHQPFDGAKLPNGIYRIMWASQGSSLASVGRDRSGDVWFMPSNWVDGPSFDWSLVDNVEKIEGKQK